MAYRVRARTFVLSLAIAVLAAPLLSIPAASADPSVSLTKDVTVAAPPSSSFAGANSGDGWDVLFYGDRVFNIFHHGSQFVVDCHLQTDGSHCDTVSNVSPWPKTVVSPDPAERIHHARALVGLDRRERRAISTAGRRGPPTGPAAWSAST